MVGEIIDYQFKVTHLNEDNQPLFFWSERRSMVVEPRVNVPPGGGGGGGGGGCQDTLALVSGPGASGGASAGVVSANGAFIAFVTRAALDANDTNGVDDVYRREVASGNVVRVSGLASVASDLGGSQPAISSDGRFVAFTSRSDFDAQDTNGLDDVYRRDVGATGAGAFVRISGLSSVSNDRGGSQPSISSDGRFVAFTSRSDFDAQDDNDADDVYRRDANATNAAAFARASGLSSVSNDLGGNQPAISADGRFVAFTSRSNFNTQDTNDAEDVYRRDMNGANAGAFVRISGLAAVTSDQGGNQPAISTDGRFVAFTSRSNFDAQDTNGAEDVYRRDANAANAGAFVRASGLDSVANDRGGNQPAISGDGRFVVFASRSNFDPQDTNDADDVYRRDMDSGSASSFIRISGLASAPADRGGRLPSISKEDGLTVVFTSRTAFEANDTNDADDVYRRTLCP